MNSTIAPPPSASTGEKKAPRSFTRWRIRSLVLVHLLIVAHITHWAISGKSLAPLELNEVMYTLELGIITAGAVFMLLTVVVTAIVGRFFCSWACHILALQDLAAALLRRVGIKPRPIRSRLLLWVPLGVMTYMFIWPQAQRLLEGRGLPTLRLLDDEGGWASFTTTEFWRNLPGPGIAIATLAACGFGFVYLLGSRSFCNYVCPYGAVFSVVERIAPGKIRSRDACTQCGICTSVCDSGIRVHEETERHGMVVSPRCLRDLDCVAACPEENLHFGLGRPSLAKTIWKDRPVQRRYDLAFREDLLVFVIFLPTLFVVRGLYDVVPFFLSLVIAVSYGYGGVICNRLRKKDDLSLFGRVLKAKGALRNPGRIFFAVAGCAMLFWIHSAFVHHQSWSGLQGLARHRGGGDPSVLDLNASLSRLERADAWSLITIKRVERGRTLLAGAIGRHAEAEARARAAVASREDDREMRHCLARALGAQGRAAESVQHYRLLLQGEGAGKLPLHYELAQQLFALRDFPNALTELEACVRLEPKAVGPRAELGALLVELGRPAKGLEHLREAERLAPLRAGTHHNLAVALLAIGRPRKALDAVNEALRLAPGDSMSQGFRDHLVRVLGGMRSHR